MSDVDPVLYEERDDLAIITLNRPEKKNALTDAVIQGLSLIHIPSPRDQRGSRMPSSA